MTSPTVAVIIPYFRAPDALARCMDALKAGSHSNIEFFVRDNSEDNIFYTKAVNEGLLKCLVNPDIAFALALNQDAFVFPNTLKALLDHMEADPRCAIACPLQLNSDGTTVSWGGSWEAFPQGRARRETLASYTVPFETYWANGAAMLLRMSALREIGVMDQNMRFICSDADLSFTARARGWKVMVIPAARVDHSLSSSAHAALDAINLVKVQDMLYFAQKWLSGDLYRRLAYEGPQLTDEAIKTRLGRLQETIDAYARGKV